MVHRKYANFGTAETSSDVKDRRVSGNITGPKRASDWFKHCRDTLREKVKRKSKVTGDEENVSSGNDKITIIRDGDPAAPNLSLNCHNRVGRGEIYLMAVIGTLLQIGVLVFFGFITYYRPIQPHFQKDSAPVEHYAFPCAAIGTIALVVGMFLCAFVVEQSTEETCYKPTNGEKAWAVWIQKSHTKKEPSNDQRLETLAVVGTGISLLGFIAQFIGLRGLNWSASVAQLGAVIFMTIVRAWVRRGLAEPPASTNIISDYELDWFAFRLGNHKEAPCMGGSGGQGREYEPLREEPCKYGNQKSDAQELMMIRKKLGNLAKWLGPASTEADSPTTYTWILPVKHDISTKDDQICIKLTHDDDDWKVETEDIEAALSLWVYSVRSEEGASSESRDHENKDARLRFMKGRELGLRLLGPSHLKVRLERDLELWTPKAVPRISTLKEIHKNRPKIPRRTVGFGEYSSRSMRSSQCTTGPEAEASRKRDDNTNEDDDNIDEDTLAVECYDTLEKLFSRDLLFAFIMTVSKLPEVVIRRVSNAVLIDYGNVIKNGGPIRLHNEDLSRLAQKMESRGFGTLSEI
ncbi:hypothetical protein AAE478_005791 [Parahypoxylon ruwenzoriense]